MYNEKVTDANNEASAETAGVIPVGYRGNYRNMVIALCVPPSCFAALRRHAPCGCHLSVTPWCPAPLQHRCRAPCRAWTTFALCAVSVPLALKIKGEKKKDPSFSKGKADVDMEMPQYAAPPPPPPAAVV